MRRVLLFFIVAVALLPAAGTAASGSDLEESNGPPIPCLTTDDSAVWIQLAGDEHNQPQQVYGRFISWDPQTATIGFQSALSQKLEQIPIKVIHLEPSRPHPAAQVALPNLVSLGGLSRSYPADELSVVDGALKVPECRWKYGGHRLVFAGDLTLSDGEVHIQGEVFEVIPPQGGGGNSTGPKGG